MVKISFTSYALTTAFSYVGLIAGIIVSVMAKEELKAGKKYFILLQKVVLILTPVSLLYYFNINVGILIIVAAGLAAFLHFYFENISYAVFPFLAVPFALSYGNKESFFVQAVLIFIYGLPTGALTVNTKKQNYIDILTRNITFPLVALALYAVYALS